jgi:hypothetical protein
MTATGQPFSNCTFSLWWHDVLTKASAPFIPFPPSKGRNIFVHHFMATVGTTPDDWEAAATAMGTSVHQWKETYGRGVKKIKAQEAVSGHSLWRKRGRPGA